MPGERSTVAQVCSPWIAICICSSAGLWIGFYGDMRLYTEQQPAMCVDGRLMGETLTNSRLGVDDNLAIEGAVTMRCSFPVAVYKCWDDQINYKDWDGYCRSQLASHPMFADDDWPRRMEETEVKCHEGSLSSNKCSDKDWSCSTGACDASEKSMRLCAAMIRRQPYKCFAFEGEPSAGVLEEASGFPVGWLIAGILVSILAIACCVFSVSMLSQDKDCKNFWLFSGGLLTTLACIGIFVAIIVAVTAAVGEQGTKGLVESDYKDLIENDYKDLDLGTLTGTNLTEVAAESPPQPKGMHWAIVLLIVFGVLCGPCLILYGLYTAFLLCIRDKLPQKKLSRVTPATPDQMSGVGSVSGPVTIGVAPMHV